MTVHCPSCNRAFELTAEYLAEYAGLPMDCRCGHAILLPTIDPPAIDTLEDASTDATAAAAPVALSYAAPDYPKPPVADGIWRDGPFLVLAKGTRMPARCCVCNAPVERNFVQRTLKWIPPQHRSHVGGVSGLIGSAIADSYSQFIVVQIARCPDHARERGPKLIGLIIIGVSILSILLAIGVGPRDGTIFFVAGFVGIAAGIVIMSLPPKIRVDEFRSGCAWIKGFGEPYLAALPELSESYEKDAENAANAIEKVE
jgi:hypothetical protein